MTNTNTVAIILNTDTWDTCRDGLLTVAAFLNGVETGAHTVHLEYSEVGGLAECADDLTLIRRFLEEGTQK